LHVKHLDYFPHFSQQSLQLYCSTYLRENIPGFKRARLEKTMVGLAYAQRQSTINAIPLALYKHSHVFLRKERISKTAAVAQSVHVFNHNCLFTEEASKPCNRIPVATLTLRLSTPMTRLASSEIAIPGWLSIWIMRLHERRTLVLRP